MLRLDTYGGLVLIAGNATRICTFNVADQCFMMSRGVVIYVDWPYTWSIICLHVYESEL